ncbi:fimbrillin family protein [Parabacteroides sp.]
MKSLVLSMLAIASMAAMSSCSNENDPVDEVINAGNQEKVEIKIAAGVLKAETKAPIGDSDPVDVAILRKDGEGAWSTTPIEVSITKNTDDLFKNNVQYYNANGDKAVFFGFFPKGTINETSTTFNAPDGKTDVLLSNELDAGTRLAPTANASLTFSHQLALIKFTFIKGDTYDSSDEVTSVKLMGAELPSGIDLTTKSLTWTKDKSNGIEAFTSGNYEIVATPGTTIGDNDALMIQPGKKISLEIITKDNGTFTVDNIKIAGEDKNPEKGKQYNIKLTFNKKSVSAAASIEGWGELIEGSGTVE